MQRNICLQGRHKNPRCRTFVQLSLDYQQTTMKVLMLMLMLMVGLQRESKL
jgi:hypothetical protein